MGAPEQRPGQVIAQLRAKGAVTLLEAHVPSAVHDASRLLAHVLGVEVGMLPLVVQVTAAQRDEFTALLARRAAREPLQHLLGYADFSGLRLAVGPGVFVPRPETELLVEAAVRHLESVPVDEPSVVDLCAGSGAIALALQQQFPAARVVAVEGDPMAQEWAQRNSRALGLPVIVVGADVTDPSSDVLRELTGQAHVVVSNPPYVPVGTEVDEETRRHDPGGALWGGADGLDVVRGMLPQVARILRPDGFFAMEHADTHGLLVPDLVESLVDDSGRAAFRDVADHLDLAGRPRFVTATRT